MSGARPIEALEAHGLGGCQPVSQNSMPSEPEARKRFIAQAIEQVVQDSYVTHPMRTRTEREDTRRASLCVLAFNRLVNERRWTPDRALSALRGALAAGLDGEAAPRRTSGLWVPDTTLIRGIH